MAFKRLVGQAITYTHGPFWHQIIVTDGKLKASDAAAIAGGANAVRAQNRDPGAGDRPVIKFWAREPPRAGTAPWLAEWRPAPNDYIEIQIESIDGPTEGHE
jgi:hypothetical protein